METTEEDVPVCKSCRRQPPAGYVERHGVYLPNLCLACWRLGNTERGNRRNFPCGYISVKTGRS